MGKIHNEKWSWQIKLKYLGLDWIKKVNFSITRSQFSCTEYGCGGNLGCFELLAFPSQHAFWQFHGKKVLVGVSCQLRYFHTAMTSITSLPAH